ncbi:MAG: AbrB/MazE/SpoVT family DNA-binding domain-containing protein [Acidimicrobiia bacterium]|nr:AbrB/MazE/SpoVT family DNA-binding domain-containing protein [Acidimicrobiia bacterium]
MRAKIDAVGRVVIPKKLRQHLGLTTAGDVEIVIDNDGLRILPAKAPTRSFTVTDGFPTLEPAGARQLTVDHVRDLVDEERTRHVGG